MASVNDPFPFPLRNGACVLDLDLRVPLLFSYVKSLSCKAKVGNDECIVSKILEVVKHVAPDEKN